MITFQVTKPGFFFQDRSFSKKAFSHQQSTIKEKLECLLNLIDFIASAQIDEMFESIFKFYIQFIPYSILQLHYTK